MSDEISPPPSTNAESKDLETDAGSKAPEISEAMARFKSCRWRRPPEDGPECCGHRDVLPIAGSSFNPEAWCPDCTFYKLRRTPKKRNPDEYRY